VACPLSLIADFMSSTSPRGVLPDAELKITSLRIWTLGLNLHGLPTFGDVVFPVVTVGASLFDYSWVGRPRTTPEDKVHPIVGFSVNYVCSKRHNPIALFAGGHFDLTSATFAGHIGVRYRFGPPLNGITARCV